MKSGFVGAILVSVLTIALLANTQSWDTPDSGLARVFWWVVLGPLFLLFGVMGSFVGGDGVFLMIPLMFAIGILYVPAYGFVLGLTADSLVRLSAAGIVALRSRREGKPDAPPQPPQSSNP